MLANYLSILGVIISLVNAADVNVLPKYNNVKTNVLHQLYRDLGSKIYTVRHFDDLKARDLLKYGTVRISSSNSIISSQLLAEEAFNPNYVPTYEYVEDEDEETRTKRFDKVEFAAVPNDKRKNLFYEVDYSGVSVDRQVTNWVPIGACHSNKLSDTKSSFSQGYTISAGSGANVNVKFAQLLGIAPTLGLDISFGASIGGSLSCSVDAGKTLQFQLMSETITIAGLKQRPIKVNGDYKYGNGYLARMDLGEWEEVNTFTQVNKANVQTACVTDPEYLMC